MAEEQGDQTPAVLVELRDRTVEHSQETSILINKQTLRAHLLDVAKAQAIMDQILASIDVSRREATEIEKNNPLGQSLALASEGMQSVKEQLTFVENDLGDAEKAADLATMF